MLNFWDKVKSNTFNFKLLWLLLWQYLEKIGQLFNSASGHSDWVWPNKKFCFHFGCVLNYRIQTSQTGDQLYCDTSLYRDCSLFGTYSEKIDRACCCDVIGWCDKSLNVNRRNNNWRHRLNHYLVAFKIFVKLADHLGNLNSRIFHRNLRGAFWTDFGAFVDISLKRRGHNKNW